MNYKDDLYKSRSEMDHAPKKKKKTVHQLKSGQKKVCIVGSQCLEE